MKDSIIRLSPPTLPRWILDQLPESVVRYIVEISGRQFHVMEVGSGIPVLALHGNPTWSFLYRRVMQRLLGRPVRLITPDLLGLGFSERIPASDHQLALHGQSIGSLIDALDLNGFILVGQDWGGPIGLSAVASRQHRLAGLVILNTVIGPPKASFRPTAFHRFSRLPVIAELAFRGFGFPQLGLHLVQGDRTSIRGNTARAYRFPLQGLPVAPLALARMVPNNHTHPSIAELQRCEDVIHEFTGPSAIVWGDNDPILGRVRTHVERLMPNASVRRTEAGHFLQEEVPDEIADAICEVAGI